MKTKIKITLETLPQISSQRFQSEENSISIATYTTAYARLLTKMAVKESRLKLSLLFSCCLTKRIKPVFPIQLGESASWVVGRSEKEMRAAATPVVYFTVLS
jgi:hypothetical protein